MKWMFRYRQLSSFFFPFSLCWQQNILVLCMKRLQTSQSLYLIEGGALLWGISLQWMDSQLYSHSLARGFESVLLVTAGLMPQQIHPRLFTGPLLAHRNWQLYSAVCKARSQALECVEDLGWGRTAWLICNHADRGSDFIKHGKVPFHSSETICEFIWYSGCYWSNYLRTTLNWTPWVLSLW